MSTNVNSPSDGGYQYYQRTISDLEDDLKSQTDQVKQASKDRADAAERSYRKDLERKEEAFNRETDRIRKDTSETSRAEIQRARDEVQKFKEQTYDRFGKTLSQERADLRAKEAAHAQEFDLAQAKHQADLRDLRTYHEQQSRELAQKHEDQLNRVTDQIRGANQEAADAARARDREIMADFRAQAAKTQQGLERQKAAELSDEKRNYRAGLEEKTREFDQRAQSGEQALLTRQEQYNRAADRRAEAAVRESNRAHEKEMGETSALIKQAAMQDQEYQRGRAEGFAESTHEYENDWRAKLRHTGDAYEEQIEAWKDKVRQTEDYKSESNGARLSEKDRYYTELLRRENAEHHTDRTHLRNELDHFRGDLEKQNQNERVRHEAISERQAQEANERAQGLLEDQARNYQGTMSRQKEMDQTRIESLERELQRRTASPDAADISPAAEEAVRRAYLRDEAKTRRVDEERTKNSIDSVQREYSKRLHETVLDKESGLAKRDYEHTLERDRDRRDFVNFAQESESNHEEGQRRLQQDNDRAVNNLTRAYSSSLDKQKRESDLSMLAQQTNAEARISEIKQKADFDAKMSQRAFANQQNELTREYDRKLADQESEHTRQMTELKDTTAKQLREGEVNTKRALDDQARSYDQRIAQMEMQHKERERIITQNYQDQLDQVKRKNALLISKKG